MKFIKKKESKKLQNNLKELQIKLRRHNLTTLRISPNILLVCPF
jgi:hypothetical protein